MRLRLGLFCHIDTTIISKLLTVAEHALIISLQFIGEVLELADRRDLGSRAARREGSTPSFPIRDLN